MSEERSRTEAVSRAIGPLRELSVQVLRSASELEGWAWRNVVTRDVSPRRLPAEVEAKLETLREHGGPA